MPQRLSHWIDEPLDLELIELGRFERLAVAWYLACHGQYHINCRLSARFA